MTVLEPPTSIGRGGPSLPQERRLVTEIPGPKSREWTARREAAVSAGVGVAFDHAYHGRTNLTMALTAKNQPYKSGFGPFAPEVYRAPLSYPFRDGGLAGPEAAARAIDQIEKQVGVENLAALLIEPIQGEG